VLRRALIIDHQLQPPVWLNGKNAERRNLSMRMHMRRFTRLTNDRLIAKAGSQ